MKNKHGMSLIEVMMAVLILAFAILPISDMLTSVTKGSKDDKAEAEALQYSCDLMDKILMDLPYPVVASDSAWQAPNPVRPYVDLRYKIYTANVPWNDIKAPKIEYHDRCDGGIESHSATEIDSKTTIVNKDIRLLDKEKVPNATTKDFDLQDIKVVVQWKSKSHKDSEYDRNPPIILYTRKARLD